MAEYAIVRDEKGRFMPGTEPPNKITNPTQAHALARARWDKQREAWAAGIVQAIDDTGMLPPGDDHDAGAWQVIANKATTLLLDSDNARGFAELARLVGRNAGYTADDSRPAGADNALLVSDDTAARILDLIERVLPD